MASFEIISFKSEDYRVLYNCEDAIEFTSIACESKRICFNLIIAIRRNSKKTTAFQISQLSCGSWFFYLKNTTTNAVLGQSKTYIEKSIVLEKLKTFQLNMSKAAFINKRMH